MAINIFYEVYTDILFIKSLLYSSSLKYCAARIVIERRNSKETLRVLNWLSFACRRKLHKCILVFKYLTVPKYLTQYFTSNRAFHDHAIRSSCNDLHSQKPKHNRERQNLSMRNNLVEHSTRLY